MVENGSIPIYSANVFEEFGRIDKQNITDFSVPSILWGIDGDWMVNIIPANKPFYPTDHCGVLRIKTDDIVPKYMALALQVEGEFERFSRTNRASTQRISNLTIQIPSVLDQQKVVGEIESIDKKIANEQAIIIEQSEKVKSRFIELFGDTILNPFGWEKDSLGTVCDVRDGTHDSPTYYEIGYPLVTSKNVTGGKIDLTDCSFICEEDFNKINERSKVDIGDIIMPMIGTVGKPVIVDMEPNFAIKNVALIKFKADSRVLNIYIRALLQSDYFDDVVLSKVRGGTQKFISLGDIRKLEILVPPMELQNQFAAFVKQTDKSKFEAQERLGKLNTEREELIDKYFR